MHYQTQFAELRPKGQSAQEFKYPPHHVELQEKLLNLGYVVLVRDDNPYCKHCTELTLIRARCPNVVNTK